jgi:translation initiation factor IF-2
MNKKMIAALALGAACLSAPAAAGLYRCGSSFQDRPCESAEQQQTIRPGKGAGSAVVAPPAAAASASAPTAAESSVRAASAASAPRPASARDPGPAAPAAAATTVPASATARTAGTTGCGKVRKQGNTLAVRPSAGGSAATTQPQQQQQPGDTGC